MNIRLTGYRKILYYFTQCACGKYIPDSIHGMSSGEKYVFKFSKNSRESTTNKWADV